MTDLVLTYNKLTYFPDQLGDLPKLDYLVCGFRTHLLGFRLEVERFAFNVNSRDL